MGAAAMRPTELLVDGGYPSHQTVDGAAAARYWHPYSTTASGTRWTVLNGTTAAV